MAAVDRIEPAAQLDVLEGNNKVSVCVSAETMHTRNTKRLDAGGGCANGNNVSVITLKPDGNATGAII